MRKSLFVLLLLLSFSASSFAFNFPMKIKKPDPSKSQIPAQIAATEKQKKNYNGIRLGIIQSNNKMNGVALSLISNSDTYANALEIALLSNNTEKDTNAFQLSLFGNFCTEGNFRGWQNAFAFNQIGGNATAIQLACVINIVEQDFSGLQLALYGNRVESGTMRGIQLALVNKAETSACGLQIGAVNYAKKINGIQFGIYNKTQELHGLQIGIINFTENGITPFMPILNAAF